MNIRTITTANQIHVECETVLVLGYFDGLHLGHQELFKKARQIADEKGLKVALLTFPESPKLAFVRYQSELLLHLQSPEDRFRTLKKLGVDELYLIDFTTDFASKTAKEFIDQFVKALRARVLIAGFDYSFGCDKKTASDLSAYFGGQVEVIEPVLDQGEKISSTRIRKAVLEGRVKEVARLLGRSLASRGIVVHGDARGRTIGYPTANLAPIDRTYLPSDGVYVVDVDFKGQTYRGMASVGKNVTFDGKELRFEVNLFDFTGDIYGHTLTIHWLDKIRDMVKFDGVASLVAQLEEDEAVARQWSKT
ncbi:MAG: bifunctional riboflavin kinase/FAD synthetase [Streptococcus parasanguinis]|uniref:bifunctional riboflavin kinase/FAD synthetase n=1 Tax=uncultured Streptococcus sp. TaxID=83427 RepID=UPI0028DC90EF|nr:bifunctional riboflavin kinase/FAD synthetase [uncultured Streptococcus sp.]MBS5355075.1 bifunctional riboflavin kinase/FAD synthetase [Streptococcus parasanguinis]